MLTYMTALEEHHPQNRLGHLIRSLELEVGSAKDAALRPLGLTVPQYMALLVISDEPGISGAELARRCLVTPQTMTTVLTNLSSKGLIERRSIPGQGRAMETTVTANGKRLLTRADKKALEVEEQLVGSLRAADIASFKKMLTQAREAFAPLEDEPTVAPAKKTAAKTTAKKTAARKPAAKKTAKKAARKRTK